MIFQKELDIIKMYKILLYVACGIIIFFGGMFTNSKLQREIKLECPECPDLKCPPNVSVNTLSLDDLRRMRVKGDFIYSPVFSGTLIFKDSTSFK